MHACPDALMPRLLDDAVIVNTMVTHPACHPVSARLVVQQFCDNVDHTLLAALQQRILKDRRVVDTCTQCISGIFTGPC